jgi:hypothetical protein
VLLAKYYHGYQLKGNEMGGECGTYGGEVRAGFWQGNLSEVDHLEDLSVGGRVILYSVLKKSLR